MHFAISLVRKANIRLIILNDFKLIFKSTIMWMMYMPPLFQLDARGFKIGMLELRIIVYTIISTPIKSFYNTGLKRVFFVLGLAILHEMFWPHLESRWSPWVRIKWARSLSDISSWRRELIHVAILTSNVTAACFWTSTGPCNQA